MSKFRAIEMRLTREHRRDIGWLRALWGLDIWLNDVPILKTLVAANVVVWVLMWRALR